MGKEMKAKKAMKVSKVARGSRMRAAVLSGRKEKTYTGLKASDLMKNSVGKIVTRKKSASAKRKYEGSKIQQWTKAVSAAREQLGVSGFVGLNSGSQGKALYVKAKAIYTAA